MHAGCAPPRRPALRGRANTRRADGAGPPQTSSGNFLEGNSNVAGEGMERAGSHKSFAWKGGRVRQVHRARALTPAP